jgi:hypothetical protein
VIGIGSTIGGSILVLLYLASILTITSYVNELSSIIYILGTLRNSDVKKY